MVDGTLKPKSSALQVHLNQLSKMRRAARAGVVKGKPKVKKPKPITVDEYNKKFGEKPREKPASRSRNPGDPGYTSPEKAIADAEAKRKKNAPKPEPRVKPKEVAPPKRVAKPAKRVAPPRRIRAGQTTAPSRANPKRLKKKPSGKRLVTTPGAAKGAFYY
jgi:hypothetical protein